MKFALSLGILAATLCAFSTSPHAGCDPIDQRGICGLLHAEDMVSLPVSEWVVVSSLNLDINLSHDGIPLSARTLLGPLQTVNAKSRKVRVLFPSPDALIEWDQESYPECPAPPNTISTHGINIRHTAGQKVQLLAVNHGDRESIEVFDIELNGHHPKATWRGCIIAPPGIHPNAVTSLPGSEVVLSGGGVAVWTRGGGWDKTIPFESSNGIEASRDGTSLYVNDSKNRRLIKMTISGMVSQSSKSFDFVPDNVRWGDDGYLYVAGPNARSDAELMRCFERPVCDLPFVGLKIDPESLKTEELIRSPGIKETFGSATVMLPVQNALWFGTFRGDRILTIPNPP